MSQITKDAAVDAVVNHTTTTTTTTSHNNNNNNIHNIHTSSSSSSVEVPRELPHYYYATQVQELHESVQRAIDLVQYYSEQAEHADEASTNNNNNNNINTCTNSTSTSFSTTNPDEIYEQLDMARNQITASWQTLSTAFHSNNNNDDDDDNSNRGNPLTEQEQIRIAYLNMITDSFGNVLANLHNNNNNNNGNDINVDVLADCLQSGYDLLTQFNSSASATWYENDFVWNDNDNDDDDPMNGGFDHDDDDDDNEDEDVATPHERHRQQLGFQEVH